ncbi:3-deoxy-7-phosphoheptulonate synthase [Actinomadura terrae]|uniref:3-deoxy-7-phosphoheptulonate synthase n=1 Tax=Actinomadura terrae TaxID=604353 RepID=UPI001FA72741|nr:3-deoxy-7-phosphoheptulonate synthase [Actinomadura terrae]
MDTVGTGEHVRLTVPPSSFDSPATRMLLSSDGSTTRLLKALLPGQDADAVRIRVLNQRVGQARDLERAVRAALATTHEGLVIERSSALVDAHLRLVSLNRVVMRNDVEHLASVMLTGVADGIGAAMEQTAFEHYRQIVETGLDRWPPDGAPAACKVYVVMRAGEPLMYLKELFNPSLVSPASRDVPASERFGPYHPEPAPPSAAGAAVRATGSVSQQPSWDRRQAAAVREELARLPGVVCPAETRELARELARVAAREALLLQVGDCAETFDELTAHQTRARHSHLHLLAAVLAYGTGLPITAVGRMAGQYAKPRSEQTETVEGRSLPTYRGDAVNRQEPTPADRRPDPNRLIAAYLHAGATMNALRAADRQGIDRVWIREALAPLEEFAGSDGGPDWLRLVTDASHVLLFVEEAPVWKTTYTSHEALLFDYEEPLIRIDEETATRYELSGHMLWVGERTRKPGSAHLDLAASVANPVGVKIGPNATGDEVLAICRTVNPRRIPGRLTLVTRMGASTLRRRLPVLADAVRAEEHEVIWCCDPMHANTTKLPSGHKTRGLHAVLDEVTAFFETCRSSGLWPGGLHLETATGSVTECTGGIVGVTPAEVPRRYGTACDPRLNPLQALETVGRAAWEWEASR